MKTSLLSALLACGALMFAISASAAHLVTLPDFQAEYNEYSNHAEFVNANPNASCVVDGAGTLELVVNVADIVTGASEPTRIVMVCQAEGFPAFSAAGPVTFSQPGVSLVQLSNFPGFPDAFAVEFEVAPDTGPFKIIIQNTGWPQGCFTMLDFAAYGLLSVDTENGSFGHVKALF